MLQSFFHSSPQRDVGFIAVCFIFAAIDKNYPPVSVVWNRLLVVSFSSGVILRYWRLLFFCALLFIVIGYCKYLRILLWLESKRADSESMVAVFANVLIMGKHGLAREDRRRSNYLAKCFAVNKITQNKKMYIYTQTSFVC